MTAGPQRVRPHRPPRGLPAWAWALTTIATGLPIALHQSLTADYPARTARSAQIETQARAAGKTRAERDLRVVADAWSQGRKANAAEPITADEIDRLLRPRGLITWHARTMPLSFTYTEPKYRYTCITTVSPDGFGWSGALMLQRPEWPLSNQQRQTLRQLQRPMVLVGIGLLLCALFRARNRVLIELALAWGLAIIAIRVASTLGVSDRNWIYSVDDYPWVAGLALLLLVLHVLWFRPSKDVTTLCPNCGYELYGNESGVCPECGDPIPPAVKARLTPTDINANTTPPA
ncbi:MAG TPA: hypothetical protein VF624_08110 [Tepidisphaeraceae bacterium]|jgi:hypothetical protein